jgi:hypothetical protein
MNTDDNKDLSLQIKEHQRALLELLIATFPEVLVTKAKEVKAWRKKLEPEKVTSLRPRKGVAR